MKNLMIVESPTKVKSIEKFLGPDFKVIASVGHVRDLVSSARKGINVDEGFKPVWKVSNNKKSVIDDIKKYTKDADVIYFATDPDREGEAISKHLYDILDKAKILKEKETHRVVFNEITKNAVTDALKKPRAISGSLWDAYLARRTLDYLMGYDISEFLWKKVSRMARAGRVQSPALRLIVEREIKINEFNPVEYWNIFASVSNKERDIEIELSKINDEKVKKENITIINDEEYAERIKSEISSYEKVTVSNIKHGQRKTKPKAPFTTASLQQTAYTSLGLSVRQTSAIAQRLYQGMDIGSGQPVGLISYMRTDSTTLSKEAIADISTYLSENHPGLASDDTRVYKSKSKNAQEAHEAIRPTSMSNTPDKVKKFLEDNDYKIYDLIWKRTLASQMKDSISKTVSIDLSMEDKFLFKYSGSYLEYPGFKEIYSFNENDEKEKENKQILESLTINDELSLDKVITEQKFTQPPARYNQASLIQALEDVVVLNDDISDETLLENEGIEDVDFFCSVTNDDQMNILSAKLAKDLGAKKSIAIVNKLSYRKLVSKEIDVVVSPEDVTIGSLLASVRTSDVVKVHSLGFGEAELFEIIIHGDEKTSKVVGKRISELDLPPGCKIGAIYRNNEVILAHEDTSIQSNDRLVIYLLHKKDFSKLAKLFQVGIGFFK